ncbi:ATP synthase F1 subunit delta [Candidatus Pelagibacter sp.]|nr:ATP synthase F1 subunit delta [Candidatus Pelagibacter sp.]MDA9594839.1 ATP synthase F1 subunit delta [Candidatus Pelagibacter sp.]
MSKNKGFSNISVERYSLALYELSKEDNSLDVVEAHSSSILELINSSKDFNYLIKDPTSNQDDLISIITKISDIYEIDNLLKNFMTFLIRKKRFFYLEKILKSFIETCSEKRGEIKAEIHSAKELSNDELNKITNDLANNFSSKMKLNYKHDKSLIGGLIVKIGSTMIDTSIKNKLQQIENRMIEA